MIRDFGMPLIIRLFVIRATVRKRLLRIRKVLVIVSDLIGRTFGRWEVVSFARANERKQTYWHCICVCGNKADVRRDVLVSGRSKSCGCLAKEAFIARNTIHGHCKDKKVNGDSTYVSWKSMRQRCYDPKSDQYRYYGALGTKVCDQWRNSFAAFVADMGPRPEGMTLDRIDPYGDYEPGNCRWADVYMQNNNQRRHKALSKC